MLAITMRLYHRIIEHHGPRLTISPCVLIDTTHAGYKDLRDTHLVEFVLYCKSGPSIRGGGGQVKKSMARKKCPAWVDDNS